MPQNFPFFAAPYQKPCIENFLSREETLASHVSPDKSVLFAALFCAVVQLKTR